MAIFYLKAFHIVGFVAWFAGLFYLIRIFVYHREALDKSEPERQILSQQFQIMEQRVFNLICQPAMIFTWTCGIAMLILNPAYLEQSWIHVKLLFLVLLTIFHYYNKRFLGQLKNGTQQLEAFHFRVMNEVPTIFLLTIVLLAVFRNNINYLYLSFGVLLFIVMIAWGIIAYRKKRES